MNTWWKMIKKNQKRIKCPRPVICLKCGYKQMTMSKFMTNCSSCHHAIRVGFKDSEFDKRPLIFKDRNYPFNVRCLVCRKGFNPMNKYELVRCICGDCFVKSLAGDESIKISPVQNPFVRGRKLADKRIEYE